MRFQDASPDARTIVYAKIQADPLVARLAELLADASVPELLMARAVMNGERTDPAVWRRIFPALFAAAGAGAEADASARAGASERSEAILAASLEVADKGDQARSSYRGAVVESVTELLLRRRSNAVRRERRVLFDGVRAEIHPYDVTVEAPGRAEIFDCKWGARGISADVLYQLEDARAHAADEDEPARVALVVFDFRRTCEIRLERATAPHEQTGLVTVESLKGLAGR